MEEKLNVCVLGAGCGGQAIAGYLAGQGHAVNLYNRSLSRIEKLMETKKMTLYDQVESTGYLNCVTTDISEAVKDAQLIMVATTATGHKDLAKKLAPHLVDDQIIVLNPGRTFGSLEVISTLNQEECSADVNVVEANTLLYATRTVDPGYSRIIGVKKNVAVSVLPYHRTDDVLSKLNQVYPQFYSVDDFMTTSLSNIGAVFHPVITLLNKERIKAGDDFEFYRDGATRDAVAYMEKVDEEKLNLAKEFGVEIESLKDWLCERYSLNQDNLYDALHENPFYQNLMAPNTLDMRYLNEDIPTGLVPLSELGHAVGVDVSHIDYLIDVASEELDVDFRQTGRNLSNLLLDRYNLKDNIKEIKELRTIQDYKCLSEVLV